MASDLSLLIEETICSTLETNLSKSITLANTLQATQNQIADLNIISIYATFAFDNTTIGLKFIIPAYISSFIFNTMMMEEGEPLLEVDDDIADAIKEVFSQVCGGLETAINGSAFEDLGSTKFSIGDYQILKGDEYTITHKLLQFNLNIDEKSYEMFIDFEESSMEHLEKFNSAESIEDDSEEENKSEDKEESQEEIVLEEEPLEEELSEEDSTQEDSEDSENKDEEAPEEDIEDKTEEAKEEETEKNEENSKEEIPKEIEDQNIEDEEIEDPEEKKKKKLKLLIIIVAGVLATVIIAFVVSYFMGVFDEEPVVVKDANKTVIPKPKIIIADIKNKQIDFKMEMINKDRLNRRLAFLTKYDILEEDALEKFKQKEKDRLYKLKMKKLEEFAANNKEESLFNKNISGKTQIKKDRFGQTASKTLSKEEKEILKNEKLTFIQISSLKYKKYKKIINKEKTKNIQTSICKNTKDKIDVYIGPIYLKTIVNNIVNKIKNKSDVKIVILTKEDFDKRCDF